MNHIMYDNMAKTLDKLNAYYVKHDIMTKDKFMDIQSQCWISTKKKWGVII